MLFLQRHDIAPYLDKDHTNSLCVFLGARDQLKDTEIFRVNQLKTGSSCPGDDRCQFMNEDHVRVGIPLSSNYYQWCPNDHVSITLMISEICCISFCQKLKKAISLLNWNTIYTERYTRLSALHMFNFHMYYIPYADDHRGQWRWVCGAKVFGVDVMVVILCILHAVIHNIIIITGNHNWRDNGEWLRLCGQGRGESVFTMTKA